MIESLQIKGFKAYVDQTFALNELTVLTGINGAGKSTLLQALLLAREVAIHPGRSYVPLNGGTYNLALGEAENVINPASEAILLKLKEKGQAVCDLNFEIPNGRNQRLPVQSSSFLGELSFAKGPRSFSYICADRIGPKDVFEAVFLDSSVLNVGVRGEAVAQILATFDTESVPQSLIHPSSDQRNARHSLLDQTELWLSSIVCPIQLAAQWILGTNVTTLKFKKNGYLSEWMRPSNTGFGLTYSLPVIVAGLTIEKGGVLLVENPEAHLHPQGQSAIGEFLAHVSQSGVQVIVETHSDHVLNGIRRAVAVNKVIAADKVDVYFFDNAPQAENIVTQPRVEQIKLNESGELSAWPTLFFDQIEKDLSQLARVRTRKK